MIHRSKWLAGAMILATFAAGTAVGSAISVAWGERKASAEPLRRHMSYAERLNEELSLTPVQRESVAVILSRRQDAMHEMWQEMQPRFDSLRAQIRADILSQLDATQRARFHALIAESDSARAARGERTRNGR